MRSLYGICTGCWMNDIFMNFGRATTQLEEINESDKKMAFGHASDFNGIFLCRLKERN